MGSRWFSSCGFPSCSTSLFRRSWRGKCLACRTITSSEVRKSAFKEFLRPFGNFRDRSAVNRSLFEQTALRTGAVSDLVLDLVVTVPHLPRFLESENRCRLCHARSACPTLDSNPPGICERDGFQYTHGKSVVDQSAMTLSENAFSTVLRMPSVRGSIHLAHPFDRFFITGPPSFSLRGFPGASGPCAEVAPSGADARNLSHERTPRTSRNRGLHSPIGHYALQVVGSHSAVAGFARSREEK